MTLRGFLSFFSSLEATDTSHGWSRSSNPFHIKSNPYFTSKITPNVPEFYFDHFPAKLRKQDLQKPDFFAQKKESYYSFSMIVQFDAILLRRCKYSWSHLSCNTLFVQVWLKSHTKVFYHSLNEPQFTAATEGYTALVAFSVLDQTVRKLPCTVCLCGRCFLVCAAVNSIPFEPLTFNRDTHFIPFCHAVKYWESARSRDSDVFTRCSEVTLCRGDRKVMRKKKKSSGLNLPLKKAQVKWICDLSVRTGRPLGKF